MEGLQLLHSLRGTTSDRKNSEHEHREQQEWFSTKYIAHFGVNDQNHYFTVMRKKPISKTQRGLSYLTNISQ